MHKFISFLFQRNRSYCPYVQICWARASQSSVPLRLLLSVLIFVFPKQYMSVKSKEKEKVWELCKDSIVLLQIHPQNILVYLLPNVLK